MRMHIGAKGKLKHFMEDPPQESRSLDEWQQDDFMIMTCLWNSMEPNVAANFLFLETAK